jgi:hypothetical protein
MLTTDLPSRSRHRDHPEKHKSFGREELCLEVQCSARNVHDEGSSAGRDCLPEVECSFPPTRWKKENER